MSYQWDHFEINYYYPAKKEQIFKVWATGEGLKSFFIEEITITDSRGQTKANDQVIKSGDSYSWMWRHNYSLEGKFLSVIENEKVEFTFGSMLVSFSFIQAGDQTLLQLKQSNIPTTEDGKTMSHMNCRLCWTFFLTNLKSVLINGTDLRDSDPQRASSFEVGYKPLEVNR